MMRKLLLWALTLVIALMPAAASAADDNEIISGILAYLSSGEKMQAWIDSSLADGAGGSVDSLIPALLKQKADYNFSLYIDSLAAKLGGIKSITSLQRSALILSILGAKDRIPEGFADKTIGNLGVMSYVFGLHLLNNGFESELWTHDKLVNQLISMQLEDGGWAVSGKYSDADVTAMCLQAMAVCKLDSNEFITSKNRALEFLSSSQQKNGGFKSYGKETCESSAQVLVALISLGIDPLSDARFIKNGNTPLDAMLRFRLPSGGFSHFYGDKENSMACIQAFSALIALENPEKPFYDFSGISVANDNTHASVIPLWKFIALGIIATAFLLGSILSLLKKRARGKRLLLLLIVCSIAAAAVWMINIETAGSYYSESETDFNPDGHVYLSIRCDTVAGQANDGSTPASGEILPRTQIGYLDGDSVFDVLTYAARKFGIHMEHDGISDDLAYINGINHLYEYAYGDLSGWLYFVNGEEMSVGCGSCPISNGDEIIWKYSTSMGDDLK